LGREKIYVADDVRAVERLHRNVIRSGYNDLPIVSQLDAQARNLISGYERGDVAITVQLRSWLPRAVGVAPETIMREPFTLTEARLSMAREYGFRDWDEVAALGDSRPDPAFEDAVDALVAADIGALSLRLRATPSLARARSRYGHRATLLHYVGANGVETYRQKTPFDIVSRAKVLIEAGADVDAVAAMYGGDQTAYGLAMTSAHPKAAGVQNELGRLLREAGGSGNAV
jgi:hypothetical protein